MTHKRAVIYCRVSTDEQAGNYSLPTQLEACRKYAAHAGLTVAAEYADDYSGAVSTGSPPGGAQGVYHAQIE